MKNKKRLKIPGWIPGVAISLIVIYVLMRFVDLQIFIQSIRIIRLIDILVFFVFLVISLVVRGAAWKFLLIDVSFKDAFLIINEGYFFNNLIPRSGEIARAILSSRVSSLNVMQVASIILFERALDVIIASGLFLSTLPLAVSLTWIQPIASILLLSLLLVIVGMLLVAFFSTPLKNKLAAIETKSEFVNRVLINGASKLIDAMAMLNRPRDVAVAVGLIASTWMIWTLMLFYGMRLIAPEAPLWWAIFAEGVLALGIAIPSAPASLGVYEGTLVVAFSVFGINPEKSLSLAVTLHFLQILTTSAFGMYGLSKHGQTVTGMVEKIRARFRKEKTIIH